MLPVQPIHNETNHGRSYVVLLCKPSLLPTDPSVSSADGANIVLSEFASSVCGAAMVATASANLSIRSVITPCASPEMCRIATRRVVATVKHERGVIWHRAIGEIKRHAVGQMRAMTAATSTRVLDTISSGVAIALPLPAVIRARLANLRPERFDLSWGNINMHVRVPSDVPRRGRSNAARHSVLSRQLYQSGCAA